MQRKEGHDRDRPLHAIEYDSRIYLYRLHILIHACAVATLLYHRFLLLRNCCSVFNFTLNVALLLSETIFTLTWIASQSFRWHPVNRKQWLENLGEEADFPPLDVFICTADPYKEPPMSVVNTAISALAFEYPMRKISVYVSDDGGSELTLFAFMEAARFAKHWLPYCREKRIKMRCPEVYFSSVNDTDSEEIKMIYERMKMKVEGIVTRGYIDIDHIQDKEDRRVFEKWTASFTRNDHPTIIQVLLNKTSDRDVTGCEMPNLIYISREKRPSYFHHFKAGALNVLLRVSEVMSNAPLIITLDCDMYSNDPYAPRRALCYFLDYENAPDLAFVQFPQRFSNLHRNDIYGCEFKRLFRINPTGMNGLHGPAYVGTGTFFNRQSLNGSPYGMQPTSSKTEGFVLSENVMESAHEVAGCSYEQGTEWGSKIGFRYGSLVEDYYTGYCLHCEGWRSVFCDPPEPAFLNTMPVNLNDVLCQVKRWSLGLIQVFFSRENPIIYGTRKISVLMGLAYAHYSLWPIWSLPILGYALVPQLALINQVSLFPKVQDPGFYVYLFVFLSSYGQELFDFLLYGGTIEQWWNDQRMWMIKGLSSFLFGFIQHYLNLIGISAFGFNVTNKVIDEDQYKHYEQGMFEFGVTSPLFFMPAIAAIINLISFVVGSVKSFRDETVEEMLLQLLLTAFIVVNCIPFYEAMFVRRDQGRMPESITAISVFVSLMVSLVISSIGIL